MPIRASTRSPAIPSRRAVNIGIPPATEASIANRTSADSAFCQRAAPDSAISSLLAVTTDLPAEIAASTISLATVVPPTSSATIATSGRATNSRQSLVRNASGCSSASLGAAVSMLREQIARTLSGNPNLFAIDAAFSCNTRSVPLPTFPSPIRPTPISDTRSHCSRQHLVSSSDRW